jgi:hypothetical protein
VAISLGVKWPGHGADHSFPSSEEVKITWSYTYTHPYATVKCKETTLFSHTFTFAFTSNFKLFSKKVTTIFYVYSVLVINLLYSAGFPVLPVIVYALLRKIFSDNDCWALPTDPIEWVLNVPSLLSLLVSIKLSLEYSHLL